MNVRLIIIQFVLIACTSCSSDKTLIKGCGIPIVLNEIKTSLVDTAFFQASSIIPLESNDNFTIKRQRDSKNGLAYIMLSGRLDNGYFLYVRIPITSIQDSVNISNNFLILIAGIAILISAIMVSIISKKFTEPITEPLNILDSVGGNV